MWKPEPRQPEVHYASPSPELVAKVAPGKMPAVAHSPTRLGALASAEGFKLPWLDS